MVAKEAEIVEPEKPENGKKSKALTQRGPQAIEHVQPKPSMEEVLMRAVEQGAPIETLERIAAMIEKAQAREAERDYLAALSHFQAVMPAIKKRKPVKDKHGNHRYDYAPIEDIMPVARPLLTQFGLSVTTGSEIDFEHDQIKATAFGHHTSGHTESRSFSVPIDREAYMSDPQKYGSASTFAERYATRQLLGIVTAGLDNDGAITPNEAREARRTVKQPQQTPTAQKAANGTKEKVQLEPAGEGEAIDTATVNGLAKAMESATLGHSDFTKRFPNLSGLEQVKKSDARVVMSWIADPVRN